MPPSITAEPVHVPSGWGAHALAGYATGGALFDCPEFKAMYTTLLVGVGTTMGALHIKSVLHPVFLYRRAGRVAFLALLAERKINNLRVINTPLESDSVPGHHLYHLKANSLQTA
jgi:hypothetical protein